MVKNSVINFYQRARSSRNISKLELIKRSQLEVRVKHELVYESSNLGDVLPKRSLFFLLISNKLALERKIYLILYTISFNFLS